MNKLQFKVLYRQFLFRLVEIELLSSSALGDTNRLFGQIAALLIFLSFFFALPALVVKAGAPAWSVEYQLIATAMLITGIMMVLSWEAILPDRRDVLVLAPLPVATRTLFLAKLAALGSALGVMMVAFGTLPVIAFSFNLPPFALRTFVSLWIALATACAFLFGCVVIVQCSMAFLLPRQAYLRLSAYLQLAAFASLVIVYFSEQALTGAPGWFLGMFEWLNGTLNPALAPLADRAFLALAVTGPLAGAAYLLSYFKTMRKIIEEPDIAPGGRRSSFSPRFGNAMQSAVVLFAVRTLARSRQHRVLLALYWGIALAVVIAVVKTPVAAELSAASSGKTWQRVSLPVLIASTMTMILSVIGTRMVLVMPRDLKSNWIFQIAPLPRGRDSFAAIRRVLLLLGVFPVWAMSTVATAFLWPWRLAASHAIVLGLVGFILADLLLYKFRKIPFTCSYLPGKTNINVTFVGFILLGQLAIVQFVNWERHALADTATLVKLISSLGLIELVLWRLAISRSGSEDWTPTFDDTAPDVIAGLGLSRDGVTLTDK